VRQQQKTSSNPPHHSLVINLVLHPLLITLLISSTIAPRLLAYRAALLPRVQEFAAAQIRGAPSRVAAPLRKGVAGLGELGWAVAGVWVVWVFVGRTAALAVAVWVVKTSFEGVEKGRVAAEVEGGKVSARADVAVRE
jgi:hypothetical protein